MAIFFLRAGLSVFLLLVACSGDEEPAPATHPAAPPPTKAAPPRQEPRRHARVRPATPTARVAALRSMDASVRADARRRSEALRSGRRLGRSGDHEASLAAFEAALAVSPGDPTLLCEAGYQALRLERLDRAAELLVPAISRPMAQATRGACLYNLGRVREAQGQRSTARTLYEQSLQVRPHRVVQARLDQLGSEDETPRHDVESVAEEPGLLARLQARGAMPTFEALGQLADCYLGDSSGTPPEPSPGLRELFMMSCVNEQEFRTENGILVVRSDAGWSAIWPITASDTGDMYGRIEPFEMVKEPLVWAGNTLHIQVDGADDEVDGEASAYFECEHEHDDDQDALNACFADATADQGEPRSWTREFDFELREGELVLLREDYRHNE